MYAFRINSEKGTVSVRHIDGATKTKKNKVKGKQQAITTKKVAQQQQPNDITRIFESVLED